MVGAGSERMPSESTAKQEGSGSRPNAMSLLGDCEHLKLISACRVVPEVQLNG